MSKHRKPFRFYFYMFLFGMMLVVIYAIYNVINHSFDLNELLVTALLPFLFVGFYYGSDTLLDKFSKKKAVVKYEANFLDTISEAMRKSDEFLIEDYRKLRMNEKFQKAVKDAYFIYENGENEVYNYNRIEKRFNKNTIEYRAIKYVFAYIKENQKNGETK